LEPVPVRADADGIDVEALAATRADAVIVTPAHGLPLGGVLAPGRRSALVHWARERHALVIEDDYDAEFRYDAEPVGTLQGLAPDVVALVGTVSKTLAPALRLGWVLAPPDQVGALAAGRGLQDLGSPLLEQLALARLMSCGGLDRHVRSLRPHYRARRDAVLAALATAVPAARVHGVAAGLHVLVELPAGSDEATLVAVAEQHGVRFYGLARHCAGAPPFPGLVLGYANHTPHELTAAVELIGELLA
ncbi:MAG: PLP-dependent aminotransferase family protein, partial [Solirubrobacterales bacterium]|nr:PLP-dependent aminotransferase family protein [Solirubrobacterales bacterium]